MRRFCFILLFVSSFASGQALFFGVNYKISSPVLDFQNYIKPISYVGADIDFRYFKNNWFSFGLKLGWSSFYQDKIKETYVWENIAVTADQWRYLYQTDFAFQPHFYIPNKTIVKPFLGGSLGTSFIQDYIQVGDLTFNRNFWGFNYTSEIGLLLHLRKPDGLAVYTSFGFNQVVLKNEHYKNVSNLIFKIGIAFSGQYKKDLQEKLKEEKKKLDKNS